MSEDASESSELLVRIVGAQIRYAQHHRVAFPEDTLKAVVLLAKELPYLDGDAYETALDLLEESGAEARAKRVIKENGVTTVGLQDLADTFTRKTGRTLDDFIQ